MDTHGHEECAMHAGRPLIEAALAQAGRQNWRLEAFYFGNWLTDVSQVIDPVAIGTFRRDFEPAMYRVLDTAGQLVHALPDFVRGMDTVRQIEDGIRSLRSELPKALAYFTDGGRTSPLARSCADAFFVLGYKKFVHAQRAANHTRRSRMSYEAYERIFDARYTQYFPHEHLDRYPMDPDAHEGYAKHAAAGTLTADGRGTGAASLRPHIYKYLRDDLKIAAGLIADVDYNWARLTFRRSAGWSSDEVPEWNEWLAKLGHALHAIEDYFAHSNFIEHALSRMRGGERYLPAPSEGFVRDSAWEIVQKRLRRYDGRIVTREAEWHALDPEHHVVTGFFDFADTFFSIRHIYEELFGEDAQHGDSDGAASMRKLLRDTVVEVKRRTADRPQLSEAGARRVAEDVLIHEVAHGDPDERAAATELMNNTPPRVKERFLNAVAIFSARAPGATISLYDALEYLHTLGSPVRQILKYISGLPAWAEESLEDWYEDHLQDVIDRQIGRYRVGCHSLLAKDYAWHVRDYEQLDEIYRRARDLAKAVHWYIVYRLTRWSRQPAFPVCRADSCAEGETALNRLVQSEAIDWLELVEFFCRHPHSQPGPSDTRWWEPVIRHGWEAIRRLGHHIPVPLPSFDEVRSFSSDAATLRTARGNAYNADAPVIETSTPHAAGAAQGSHH